MTDDPNSDSANWGRSRPSRKLRRILVRITWVSGVVAAVIAMAVLLFVALLNVDGVHRYLLGLAQRKATAAIGVPVTLENFRVDLPALRVDLYGITIAGAAPYRRPPLLQVSHVEASARIVSLFHMKWYLERVKVDHPVVWVVEGAHGESNIPVMHGGSDKSNINLFNLAIRQAILDGGDIFYNDHQKNIDADLSDLELQASYNTRENAYDGGIAYRNGHVQIGDMQPVPHRLEASFKFTPEAFILHRAMLAGGKSVITLSGSVQNLSRPVISAKYDAVVDTTQFKQILRQQQLPSGVIEATGSLNYSRAGAEPLLEAVTVNGALSSRALNLDVQKHALSVRDVNAHYSLSGGAATLQNFRAEVLGGHINAHGTEKATGSHPHGSLSVELHGLSLRDAARLLQSGSPQPVGMSGTLNGTGTASWGSSIDDLVARINANTSGQLYRQEGNGQLGGANSAGTNVPFRGEVHGTYVQKNGRVELENTFFRTPGTSLALNGAAGKTSSLDVRLQSSDLGEVATLATLFKARTSTSNSSSLKLGGQASFHGKVSGDVTAPRLTGYVEATHLRVNSSSWKSFHANIGLSPSFARMEDGYLAPKSQGSIRFSAETALNHWSVGKANSIEAALNASQLKLSDLTKFAERSVPVTGVLNANVHMRGSIANPEGSGKVQLIDATAYNQRIRAATASFSARNGEISANATTEIAGGQITVRGSINPGLRTYNGQITSTNVHLERLDFVRSRDANTQGTLTVDASGKGSFDNPGMDGRISIGNASVQGRSFSGVDLHVKLADRVLSADISSKIANSTLKGHGKLELTGNYPVDVSLDTETLPLQPLLALYSPEFGDDITGKTQVHLEAHGPLKDRQALTAEIAIPIFNVSYKNIANIAAAGPVRIDYQRGILRVQPATFEGTDTKLQVQGTIPLYSSAPPSLQVLGNVNLQVARIFDPDLRSSGTARIDIHSGNPSNGGLAGQVELVGANVAYGSVPIGLNNANGVLTLNGNRIDITKFSGNIGGGTVTAQGGVALRPKLTFDLGMAATNVRMLYPTGMRETLNADLRFTGSTERALLGGTVGISDISFTPAFDLTSMIGQFSSRVAAPTAPGFSQNIFLNVAIHSTNVLSPSSRTMSVAGTAALTVRGTAEQPALVGRVNLNGGSMIFNGDRFVVTGGTIQFVDPNQIRPVLNVTLTTTVQQYDIDLRFTGPTDQLRGEFTSNPSLPRADIISLLALGTTTEAQAANPTPASQNAESKVASQVSSQVTSRISKIAGISQLSISPVLTSGTAAGPPGAVITIRQQVTGNLFITFSSNVASTQDQTIQGEYRLSPRVSVSATRDPNGGFAIDTLIRKSW